MFDSFVSIIMPLNTLWFVLESQLFGFVIQNSWIQENLTDPDLDPDPVEILFTDSYLETDPADKKVLRYLVLVSKISRSI